MDFHLDEDLLTVQELAGRLLAARATTERVREVETTATRTDEALWRALADGGLLGIALPEEHGGAGLGPWALAVLLEEQGRTVAPVPLWSASVAALAVARHGSAAQRADLLPAVAEGETRLALALEEYVGHPARPTTSAVRGGTGWRLTGTKAVVPTPRGADHVLVSAGTADGPGLFLVPTEGAGVGWELAAVTTHDLAGELRLDDAPAEPVGEPGGPALADTLRVAAVALAALQLGVADGALRHAAAYLKGREQFGRPLGTFQAVQHQLADCWIDLDAMRVTLWQALADLDGDDPAQAERAALVATWWRTQAGLDVVHRVQHLHGGIGVDVDYPVHRHFLWGRQLAATLGGSAQALADLGDRLAEAATGG